ncbi:bifunctional folylpolyglutamate synthase/dihydrofolate synthase [Streptococcus saliviloxodontae]|uniref:Dihydrofolate synthase/folylpolyglutamate synthase n=1 Tax=Streptococcus saliviloxodontae TaxID=1349416 RepID=A0ABS2PLU1_9STRE|nr:folylpolyglutamate synthase/dihydrofolate synthase family protein [Streptococcus saliviloxodontae]MBM7636061.1 dihydrofolate synthase/folylpolyglutamate synthase [Streptococcus saliviloxodontae]
MTYQETLQFIHSFKANGRQTSLKRMNWLLEQVGNPQHRFSAVHIVGTNGKGSTTAYLQHIFTQSGYQTGTFTSPFITRFNERIAIDANSISDDDLITLVEQLKPYLLKVEKETDLGSVTEFELVTLLMFLYFAQQNVDIAFIEAGIGGEYDATHVFHPRAMVCTSIGFDHTDKLGTSLIDIAKHKVGVIEDDLPFIFAKVPNKARQVFYNTAYEYEAPTFELGQDFKILTKGNAFDFSYHDIRLSDIKLKMLGQHQQSNAALAIMTSLVLSEEFPNINLSHIKTGLEKATWPGRSELMTDNIILDGAHNPQGLESLKDMLDSNFSDRQIHILFAGLKRKPISQMLAILDDFDLSVTSFDFFEALPLDDYDESFNKVTHYQNWLAQSQTSDDLFVITGSLYFISEVRNYLLKTKKTD